MRDLVQKLPSVSPQHDHGTSDDTIAAVLATLNEVIKKHPEFSRYSSQYYKSLPYISLILLANVTTNYVLQVKYIFSTITDPFWKRVASID